MGTGLASLEIARSGMQVNEDALRTTSHNISNVNTKGYARQQVIFKASNFNDLPSVGQIGTGASVQETRQIRNEFLDGLYRIENNAYGYWQCREKVLNDIQNIIGEPLQDGIQNLTNQFWDAWQELAKDPTSLSVRSLVKERGAELAQELNRVGAEFSGIQIQLDNEIANKVTEINNITKEIAVLNIKILEVEVARDNANDFRDRRANLLDQLSGLADCQSFERPDGQIDVYMCGYNIVSKNNSFNLVADKSVESGIFNIVRPEYAEEAMDFSGGFLKGILTSRGEVVGADDSLSNGTPNTKVDITFAIDLSDTSSAYLGKIQQSVSSYVNQMDRRGLDYNLRLITYKGANTVVDNNFATDKIGFINAVRDLNTDAASLTQNFGDVETLLTDTSRYRVDANRYAFVFTAESPSGNELLADVDAMKQSFLNSGVTAMVVGPSEGTYDPLIPAVEDHGWSSLADATGGAFYDINTENFSDLLTTMTNYVNGDVNKKISNITATDDIVPFMFKKVNAYTNVLLREVNYAHSAGRVFNESETLQAEAFFVPINPAYPLKIGNIRINPKIVQDVDNISASATDAHGDNTIANTIAQLRRHRMFTDSKGNVSSDDYYQVFIMDVGTLSGEATRNAQNQERIVNVADNNRKSVSAVSMDEEMADALKYKFAYNASSRAFNVIDSMIDNIINKMGNR